VKQYLEAITQALFIKTIPVQVTTNILALKEYHKHPLLTDVNFALAE
jgi:hypothetical protein